MDEIRKAAQKAAHRAAEEMSSPAPRSVAAAAFGSTMQQMYIAPSVTDHLRGTFGADKAISVMAEEIESWKEKTPENNHLVVTLRTPDSRVMVVETVKANGWQAFVAEGYVDGMKCMVTGHIATLSLFCSYEEDRGKSRAVGFTAIIEPISEPQPESAPIAPDKP